MSLIGMQVQSLVVAPPAGADCSRLLHNDKRRSPLAQTGGGCEAGWPGAYHQRF
jgi:hypothetical protein